MTPHKGLSFAGIALALAGAGFGCASAPPPKELVDARAAYNRAQDSEASNLSPAALHEAKVALSEAERAYMNEDDSPEVRDAAYVAARKAEFAEVDGRIVDLKRKHAAARENAAAK